MGKVREWLISQNRPPRPELFGEPTDLIGYWHQFESLTIIDDCIYRQIIDSDGSVQINQLSAPKGEVSKILTMLHNDIAACHLGIAKTLQRVRKNLLLAWCQRRC